MALLQKLKSLLGLTDSSSQQGGQRDVGVTVEHEGGGQASTATENAVKGTDAGTDATGTDATGTDATAGNGQPAAADTDAAASTGSMTDADPDTAAEPAEAAGPVDEAEGEPTTEVTQEPGEAADEGTAADVEASAEETDAVEEAEAADEAADEAAEDVEVIKGIGPAYASRLADVGIETVADLAAADAEAIAAETDLSETRVGQWIERAKHR